jgi:hypothetical protein
MIPVSTDLSLVDKVAEDAGTHVLCESIGTNEALYTRFGLLPNSSFSNEEIDCSAI